MKQLFLVFLGGGIGSCFRFILGNYFNPFITNFYLGTFLVNILGCLLIGLILGLTFKQDLLSENQALILATGFCGGFTTFSAFAYESQNLIKNGEFAFAALYIGSSVLLGVLAVLLGLWLIRSI